MHEAPETSGEDIVRTARIDEGAESDRNDRTARLAWAAGFIDGDGSIGIYRNGKRQAYILFLQATQVNPAPLKVLQELFGGSVRQQPGGGKRRDYFLWAIAAQKAGSALRQILPFLQMKREEAEIGLAFQDGRHRVGRKLNPEELAVIEEQRQRLITLHRQSWC